MFTCWCFHWFFLTDLGSWCAAAGWGSWRWGRRCARTPTSRTEGRCSPRSRPIGPSPASSSPASGPSSAPSALRPHRGNNRWMWTWVWDINMPVSTRLRVTIWTGQVDEINPRLPPALLKHVVSNCGFTDHFLPCQCESVWEECGSKSLNDLCLSDLNKKGNLKYKYLLF